MIMRHIISEDRMHLQARAVGVSFLVHVALVLGILGAGSTSVHVRQPLVVDFSLEAPRGSTLQQAPTKQTAVLPPARRLTEGAPPLSSSAEEAKTPKEQPPATAETRPSGPSASAASPIAANSGKAREGDAGPLLPGSIARSPGAPVQTRSSIDSGGIEKARYLKEHFLYIKELVQKKALYPAMARRMGWEGRVVVAFTIQSDGTARDLKITESSGHELLNRTALDAVRRAAPFPKPPAEAVIVLPLAYRLDSKPE